MQCSANISSLLQLQISIKIGVNKCAASKAKFISSWCRTGTLSKYFFHQLSALWRSAVLLLGWLQIFNDRNSRIFLYTGLVAFLLHNFFISVHEYSIINYISLMV
jgi:hypothetical protein